jgi:predicted nucleotidyltransferase
MPEKLLNSAKVRVFRLNYEEVIRKVRAYARGLVVKNLAETVILIGSLAKGNYSPFSDIDLLIIVKEAKGRPIDRIPDYISSQLPLDVEPRVLSEEEFLDLARKKRRLIKEALENGILLAGDVNVLLKAKKLMYSV